MLKTVECKECGESFTTNFKTNKCFNCENKTASKSKTGSLRFNDGKPEVSQLDPRFLLALAELMTKSAKKYGKYNWAKGQELHTPFDSCMRHLLAFMNGEDKDKESGLSHLVHSAANIMIMWTSQQLKDSDLDTRYNWTQEKNILPNGMTAEDIDNMAKEHEDYDSARDQSIAERMEKYYKNGSTQDI